MKLSNLAASLSSLASLASANPVKKHVFNVGLTSYGVDGSSYGVTFPADTTLVRINNLTVVKSIYSNGGGFCTITGVNGNSVVITGEKTILWILPKSNARDPATTCEPLGSFLLL